MQYLRILILLAAAWVPPLQAAEPSIRLQRSLEVAGRAMTFDIQVTMRAADDGATRAIAKIDLGPLAPLLHAALQQRLPRDPCRHRGLDNWVAELRRLNLRVDEDWLLIEVEVDAEAWACVEIHRNQIRRPLSHGSVRLLLPLRVEVDDAALRLRVGQPQVGVRGPLGDAARVWFALRGEELGEVLARHASRIDAQGVLLPPPATSLVQGRLLSARFRDSGRPTLELNVELRPQFPGWADRLWQQLGR